MQYIVDLTGRFKKNMIIKSLQWGHCYSKFCIDLLICNVIMLSTILSRKSKTIAKREEVLEMLKNCIFCMKGQIQTLYLYS